ncbi:hypothetical protein ACVJGD_008412 [Bradyrhizobium sp. USDA 10063]
MSVSDAPPDDLETLKAMLLAERRKSERLRQIIKELQRHLFGRRAETLPEDQMLLGLEGVEQVAAYSETAQDVSTPEVREARAHKRCGNRGALPRHLPRIEVVVDIEDKTCPCCRSELHRIGEDRSERLDLSSGALRNSRDPTSQIQPAKSPKLLLREDDSHRELDHFVDAE